MKAAVLHEPGQDLVMEDIRLDGPSRPGEVEVQIVASAVCRSDVHCWEGGFPVYPLPFIPGHEAAGVVTGVASGTTRVREGDHVVVTWNSSCGECWHCARGERIHCLGIRSRYGRLHDGTVRTHLDGAPVYRGMDAGTFCERGIFHENALVPMDEDVPIEIGAMLGCTVVTGTGAALNTARVRRGDRVAVIGAGAVGLCAVQGARIAGAEQIIAVDVSADRLATAAKVGATDLVDASETEVSGAVAELTGGIGVDFAFEVVGVPETMEQALTLIRRGGSVVLVGSSPRYEKMSIVPGILTLTGRNLLGCCYGSANIDRDLPRLIRYWRSGELDLRPLVTSERPLAEVNDALAELRAGEQVRTILRP
ncbi:Zn-dependent alcohol dehydrogenase [Streptomyces paradoxus]|uniref:Zn-dependent alcohol dehydrogenase n=1 Tax=Streptomyces paradoxus TaxID=66375 RepID=UPI0036437364